MKKNKQHYINNKDFLNAMIEYKKSVSESSVKPRITPYIGECFMKIAVHLSHKPNFINYTFKDDMISDGIENCLTYIDNFDPEKSQNPFAYFTQIIYYAFLRRIAKEKKQMYTKYKLYEDMKLINGLGDTQDHDDKNYTTSNKVSEWSTDHVGLFIESYEEKKKQRIVNKNVIPVDRLIGKDDI